MAAEPIRRARATASTVRLETFAPRWAERIANWVQNAEEAYWLAPRTPPPITADKIRQWRQPGRQQFMLSAGAGPPVAYGEMNLLNAARKAYWLGHLIVDPAERGRGFGKLLTRELLERAFDVDGARSVSLVVFATNVAAIAAYRAVGMRTEGFEDHHFVSYNRVERLVRMTKMAWW